VNVDIERRNKMKIKPCIDKNIEIEFDNGIKIKLLEKQGWIEIRAMEDTKIEQIAENVIFLRKEG